MKIILTGTPPSTSQIYKYRFNGKFIQGYMSQEGKAKKEEWQWEMKSQWKEKIKTEEFSLKIDFYFPDKRKRDLDNFNKLILDSGTGIMWQDDTLISELILKKFIDKKNPRVEINL